MILITGATGFVGQHLLRTMRSRFPGRQIRILSRTSSPVGALSNDVQVVLGDIADPKIAAAAVQGVYGVIHLAAKLNANAHAIQEMRRVNVEGARNLYAAACAAGVRLFVHMSSAAVYGPPRHADPFREEDVCKPITPYQVTKFEAEEALRQIDPKKTRLNILRPPGIYGPGSLLELACLQQSPYPQMVDRAERGHHRPSNLRRRRCRGDHRARRRAGPGRDCLQSRR